MIAVGLSFASVAILLTWTGITIRVPLILGIIIASLATALGVVRHWFRAPRSEAERKLRDAAELFGVFSAICIVGALAPYPLAAMSSGFADPVLERMDVLLRFNWLGWYRFIEDHPSFRLVDRVAYESIFLSPALLLGYFAWTGRKAEARQFVVSFWLSASITLALFAFVPAKGPLVLLWRGPLPYVPASALYEADLIPALRDHTLHRIDLSNLQGLVSVPSFHAVSAVLFICAAWRIRPLKWPILVLNLAMLLATPVEGTHYFVDIIAGVVVALAAVAVTKAIPRCLVPKTGGRGRS